MPTKTHIEPRAEPIHLNEAKAHLRVTISDEDAYITALITAARIAAEQATWRPYVLRTYKKYMDDFPAGIIEVDRPPVRSIDSVQYIDSDGNTQTVSSSNYTVDLESEPARIEPKDSFTWPLPDDRVNAVIITYRAGYVVPFTVNTATDTLTAQDHWFADGDRVRATLSGGESAALPTGLSEETDYFVINTSGNTLQLSATSGGSAIDITDTGTGRFFLHSGEGIPKPDNAAMKLIIGHLYVNREEVVISNSTSSAVKLPNGAEWLLGKNSMQRPV